MPTNDFLPFGTGGGANVLAQASYAALAARTNGFVAGTAASQELNKAWRQSSVMAYVIGQFINDVGGVDALDDADTATLLARHKLALRSQKLNWAGTFGGSANALTWTAAPAFPALSDLVGVPVVGISASANTGAVTINVNGLGAVALTWPDGTALVSGDIPAASMILVRYDGTAFRFQRCLSPTQIKALANPVNLSVVVFDTSGSWTVPAGVKFALLEAWGGGGGGGGGDGTTYAGYGGGGGLYASLYTAVNPGDVHAITIGTGGNTSTTNGNSGIAGGSTSIGSLLTAGGGGGGGHAASSPGVGGSISAGAQVTIPGGGAFVRQMDGIGTPGGNAPRGSQGGQQGNSGQQPGGGAAGNSYNNAYSGQKGGNGRAIITFAA